MFSPEEYEKRILTLEAKLAAARDALRDVLAYTDTSQLPPMVLLRIRRVAGINEYNSDAHPLKRNANSGGSS